MLHPILISSIILLIFNQNQVESACAAGSVDNGSGGCDQCGVTNVSPNVRRSLGGNETFIDEKSFGEKIVGGSVANANSWPAQALLYIKTSGGTALCGGTLIKRNVVLTAAHCVVSSSKPGDYRVYLGAQSQNSLSSAGVVQASVSSVKVHPSYSCTTQKNDIALLTLSTPVTLSTTIQIACLPQASSTTYPSSGVNSWAVGWGTTSSGGSVSNDLKNVKLTVYNGASSCSSYSISDWSTQICSGNINGGEDTCQGDSGGPLYVQDTVAGSTKYVVAGITSFGFKCAQAGSPGIYTRVSAYLDWINSGGTTGRFMTSFRGTTCDSVNNRASLFTIFAMFSLVILILKSN